MSGCLTLAQSLADLCTLGQASVKEHACGGCSRTGRMQAPEELLLEAPEHILMVRIFERSIFWGCGLGLVWLNPAAVDR